MQSDPTTQARRNPTAGIVVRHSRFCPTRQGGQCSAGRKGGCQPGYRASVYDAGHGKKVQQTFSTLAAAKAWRGDVAHDLRRGKRVAPSKLTLREAADAWIAGATASPPTVLARGGRPYKPSVLREYERNLRNYVLPEFGTVKLTSLQRRDVQTFVDRMIGEGKSGSKVLNTIMPLRVVYRHALERDEAHVNPTTGLRLPSGSEARDRAASPMEAADLLDALPLEDRALWACAFFAGLRRGELRGLRWTDVDLARGVISVRRSWDDVEGAIAPKSKKGTRTVGISALLRDHLTELKARTGRDGEQFVFGPAANRPFTPSYIRKRAAKAWASANVERAERGLDPLEPIMLHQARHTFVTLMFEAGVSLERIGDLIGHASTSMSDRYRHLLEGHELDAAQKLDAYLELANSRSRIEQLENENA